MPELEVQAISKRFGEIAALDALSFTVSRGEFFCLLGPSAAGKTTALRVVTGLERADAGRIIFDGDDLTDRPVQGRPMAMIFQNFALYPHLTVRRNLAYGLTEQRVGRAEISERVDQMAEMLRLGHTLDRLPATLSGGEQQRVAIGRALVRRPRLLLLDEPLTNLDAKLRHDTRAEFKRLHRELGMTMLYATPDQLEALTMGERLAVLRAGRIVQTGTPDELYLRPVDDFVAALVGAPTMNLLAATNRVGPAGEAIVELPFLELQDGPWAPALQAFAPGTPLWFGVRPHDLGPTGPTGADPRGPRFAASVHLTEPLGDVTVLDLSAGEVGFKMILAEERAVGYAPGDALELEILLENTHVFARETGTVIR